MFNAIFENISTISWWSVLLVEETGVLGENHQPYIFFRIMACYDNDIISIKQHTTMSVLCTLSNLQVCWLLGYHYLPEAYQLRLTIPFSYIRAL